MEGDGGGEPDPKLGSAEATIAVGEDRRPGEKDRDYVIPLDRHGGHDPYHKARDDLVELEDANRYLLRGSFRGVHHHGDSVWRGHPFGVFLR